MTRPFRYLSWIITIPLGIIVISFAVSNRDSVALKLWPLPFEMALPMFLPVLGALVAGFIAGGAIAWWSGGRSRRLARRLGGQVRGLRAELETLRAREAESAEDKARRLDAERLTAATRASEDSARQEAAAPRRLTSADAR